MAQLNCEGEFPDHDHVLAEAFRSTVAKLSVDIARAEESFVVRAIMLAGYEPIAAADAEWTKHITLHHESQGRKVICVDGAPKWAIITEAPATPLGTGVPLVDYSYTTRMEPVPYTYGGVS